MLYAFKDKSRAITDVSRVGDSLVLISEHGKHKLTPKTPRTVRVTYTSREEFSSKAKESIVALDSFSNWTFEESEKLITLTMPELKVEICKATGSYKYFDASNKLLLAEKNFESKELQSFTTYSLVEEGAKVEEIQTADGKKRVVNQAEHKATGESYHTRLNLEFQDDEYIYGLGQHEEGFGSLRGQTLYVHQANRKIAIPVFVSNLGYGIFMDTNSPLIFSDTLYGTYIYCEASNELDYYFMNGGSMAGAIKEYRFLTGKAAMLPKWAFGYMQSQERYETQEEVLRVASEYRKRGIGLDCIVQDWISWDGAKWGDKNFDTNRYPSPKEMTDTLHDMDVRFMLSIWANPGESSDDFKQLKAAGFMLPATNVYNALLPEARKMYWDQANKGLFSNGVDAWWCDSSEPFTPEWNVSVKPEPSKLYNTYCKDVSNHLPCEELNSYSYYHALTMYDGQRSVTNDKRVCNLTRSAHTGQQRLGTILWSGDISASWDTYRRQIATGLGFSASGLPYWTVDIGSFFIKNSNAWFWKGDYDDTYNDLGYVELFTRWYQWGAFLPVFRGHGTDCRRELWYFDKEGTDFYDALLSVNRLRYELMPYIYSVAGRTWLNDESMMRFLAFDYPGDKTACEIKDQYMFGDSIMVCPVTQAMYYGVNSTPIENAPKTRKVYLPEGEWYDFYTEEKYSGGQWIETDADIKKIPLFVKAGAIIPMAQFKGSTAAQNEIDYIKVFKGADSEFGFYSDSGDGYAYEQGDYLYTTLSWNDKENRLNIAEDRLKDVDVKVIGK